MSILYRPITKRKGDKYRIEEYDFKTAKHRAKLFKQELSVDTVNGAAAFFLSIGKEYQMIMLSSFKAKSKKMLSKQMAMVWMQLQELL